MQYKVHNNYVNKKIKCLPKMSAAAIGSAIFIPKQ